MLEKNKGNNNCIPISGIGNVVIPEDTIDVAEYVQRCYRNHSVSISGGYGSTYMHNVKITEDALNRIKFPSGDRQGSAVVWIRDSFTNRAIVIGVLKDAGESNFTTGYQQRLYQEAAEQVVDIFLDALNGRINISACSNDDVNAEIVIKANSGKTEGDVVKVLSKDKIIFQGQSKKTILSKDIDLLINNGEKDLIHIVGDKEKLQLTDQWGHDIILDETELHVKDAFGNEHILNEENTQILTPKFNVGEGNEQMVLGNTLVKLLGDLIDAILNLTVVTHAGPSGTPVNAAVFSAIKGRLETILSKLSNTD